MTVCTQCGRVEGFHSLFCHRGRSKPNAAHPVTADRFARLPDVERYRKALEEIATLKPSAASAIAEIALKGGTI